jgi:hypothetical protein
MAFLFSVVFDPVSKQFLLMISLAGLRITHNTPERDIPIANFPQYNSYLNVLLHENSDKPPPLDHLHWPRPVGVFADRTKEFTVFLKRSGLFDNLQSQWKKSELEELFLFGSLPSGGELEVMETV